MKFNRFTFITAFLFALMCTQNAFARKEVFGGKDMPLEVNLLVANLQADDAETFDKILPIIMNIDLYARSMSKEDIFLIGKIEVYKTLLKNYDTPIKQPLEGPALATLKAALAKTKDNFLRWFLTALLKDTQDIIGNPKYKEFLLQKNSGGNTEKVEYRKLEKKAELIQYWVTKISPDAQDFPETLKNDLKPKMMEALKNIQNSFELMAKEASLTAPGTPLKAENELKFFIVKEASGPSAPAKAGVMREENQKSVEEILSPLTNPPTDLPAPSQENWLEEENAPPALQNLPKPTNDANWLEDF